MSEQLNVIVVVLDCARAHHLSCYGYMRETTPFLDQIAREGVRFSNMIATAPWTLPAHASLFTGLYSVTHGATDENRFLSSRHKRLPEHLQAAGYRTAAFCTNPWVSPETGFGRGFDAFFTQRSQGRVAARALFYGRKASDTLLRRNDSGARRTNLALRRWIAANDQPFFAFVHYNEPHLRYHLPPPYDRLFLPRGVTAARARAVNQDCNAYIARQVEMTEHDFTILAALYDGTLRYVDTRVREIADFLRARGAWDRTLFLVTADHGENLGEHNMMGHKFVLFDTLLRVPLLLRCPSRVPQGFVIEELAQSTDILPTILALLEISDPTPPLQGRALFKEGGATPGPSFTISERFRPNLTAFQQRFPAFDATPFNVRQKSIRTKREKFIWRSDEANEYYDLVADPGEGRNLFEDEPERAQSMRRQLFDWLASVEKFEFEEQAPEINEGMRQQLQGIGYID
jgi:arylsulfatase A-like enzyme